MDFSGLAGDGDEKAGFTEAGLTGQRSQAV